MNDNINLLTKCKLFKGMNINEIDELLSYSSSVIKNYNKGEFVFHEEDEPTKIYILLKGKVSISKETLSGNKILITNIQKSLDIFGEIYIFIEKKKYDISAEVTENSIVFEISNDIFSENKNYKSHIEDIIQYNLMCIFASKAYFMKSKIKILCSGTIREKIVSFLFENQKSDGTIHINMNREEMADFLNVTRPSLSRELSNMQKEQIIKICKKDYIIINQDLFESYL